MELLGWWRPPAYILEHSIVWCSLSLVVEQNIKLSPTWHSTYRYYFTWFVDHLTLLSFRCKSQILNIRKMKMPWFFRFTTKDILTWQMMFLEKILCISKRISSIYKSRDKRQTYTFQNNVLALFTFIAEIFLMLPKALKKS